MHNEPIQVSGRSHYGSNFWDAYSPKLNRDVSFYSDLEYDYWILLEMNKNVTKFCEQPLKVRGKYEGKTIQSIFDIWILWSNNTQEYVEIKYSKDLSPASRQYKRVTKQIAIQKQWCLDNNVSYSIKTELEIRKNITLLNNFKTLLPYLRYSYEALENDSKDFLYSLSKKPQKLSDLSVDNIESHKLKIILSHLYYDKQIKTNLGTVALGALTEVWRNE